MHTLKKGDRVQVNDHSYKRWGETGTVTEESNIGAWVRWDNDGKFVEYDPGELCQVDDPVWVKKRTFIDMTLG